MLTWISGDAVRCSTPIEDHQQDEAGGDREADPRVVPAPDRRLLEAEDAEPHAGRDQDQAAVVHPCRRGTRSPAWTIAIRMSAISATGMLTQKIARQVHSVR